MSKELFYILKAKVEFFDNLADKWDQICRHDHEKIRAVLALFQIKEGSNILDVGTGTGILLPYLSNAVGRSGHVTAIDSSGAMILQARQKNPFENVEFIAQDVFSAPLAQGFDFIFCYGVFPHFEDKAAAVRHFSGLLKKGGTLVIFHSESRDKINLLHRGLSSAVSGDQLPDLATVCEYFETAGLTAVCTKDDSSIFLAAAAKQGI